MFGFALLVRSSFKQSLWPPRAARCSAVLPLSSKRLLTLGQSRRSRVAMRRRRFPRAACFSRAFSVLSSSHIAAHNRPTKLWLCIFEAELMAPGIMQLRLGRVQIWRAFVVGIGYAHAQYQIFTSVHCIIRYGQGLHSCFKSLLNH